MVTQLKMIAVNVVENLFLLIIMVKFVQKIQVQIVLCQMVRVTVVDKY